MSRGNVCRPLLLRSLLVQILAIVTLAIPHTNPVSLLNDTTTPTASMPNREIVSQNATSPSLPLYMFDYHIVGTPLTLRITETGHTFSQDAVNNLIDSAIRRVVGKINTGSGNEPIEGGRFWVLSSEIDMRISALGNGELTYFLLGKQFRYWWGGFFSIT